MEFFLDSDVAAAVLLYAVAFIAVVFAILGVINFWRGY